jgi:HK97 family phage prohead protease
MSEILTRAAAFSPASYNASTFSLEAIISTGADVTRRDYQGEFLERLPTQAANWTMARTPVPVLRDHERTTGALVGIASNLRSEGNAVLMSMTLSGRDDLAGFRSDVQAGILSGVSIGYGVPKWIETTEAGRRVKTAESVVLHEISFTPTPADAGAGIRSIGVPMDQHEQIRSIATAVGVADSFADDLIARNVNVQDARAALIREAARLTPPIDSRQPATVTRETSPEDITRAAGEALFARINPSHRLSDQARPFAGRRPVDLYRAELGRRGHNTLGSDTEVLTRALHTISDFSSGIFSELFNKSLLQFNQTPPAITQIFKRATVSDFRERHLFEISDGPGLLKVNETGEVKGGTIADKKLSSYKIDSYARLFGLSFQAQVNDDMGALADLTGKMGRGARQWFASFLIDTLIANPKLADNKAVFHADHANLAASGAAPSEQTIAAAKLAMRLQVDASGNPVDAAPKFIVIPAALEVAVDKLLAALYPTQPSDAVVSARSLTPIVEPRLDAKGQTSPWYLFAEPGVAPVFEYSELSGYEGPQVEVKQGWENLGLEIRVVWHVGAGAIDSRGAYKNPGN